ncbi:MAG: hypothetical protein A2096_01085 [Spirochaetes bacterium GWF1_41_5]|nr:MAG: hypothetical protein A2096_01085 [Spirochaetes bacterium GWF1_41_5]HBE03156.1 hypothetical protein [Spirochaetia bacterium]
MLKIAHRINTRAQLIEVPHSQGVEMDLRSHNDRLILHHDPFTAGEDFEDWLQAYRHELVILNTKSEGMEEKILAYLKQYSVARYFFLDLSIPFMVKQIKKGVRDIAVRFSEYEPLELALEFAGLVDWVWVDCFTRLPLDDKSYSRLKKHFKLCLVSPELQGHDINRISEFKEITKKMEIDAVCTKKPALW